MLVCVLVPPILTVLLLMLRMIAASYEAAKAWEKHCEQNGKPDSHAKAKEFMCVYSPTAALLKMLTVLIY